MGLMAGVKDTQPPARSHAHPQMTLPDPDPRQSTTLDLELPNPATVQYNWLKTFPFCSLLGLKSILTIHIRETLHYSDSMFRILHLLLLAIILFSQDNLVVADTCWTCSYDSRVYAKDWTNDPARAAIDICTTRAAYVLSGMDPCDSHGWNTGEKDSKYSGQIIKCRYEWVYSLISQVLDATGGLWTLR